MAKLAVTNDPGGGLNSVIHIDDVLITLSEFFGFTG